MKKYIALLPMLIVVGFVFYDAATYMYERYLRMGEWSVGMLAPDSVFISICIIVGLSCLSFFWGFSNILRGKK